MQRNMIKSNLIPGLNRPRSDYEYEKSDQDRNRVEIELANKTNGREVASDELLMATPSKMGRNSRVGSRRFSGTHIVQIRDTHSLQFIGMDSSSVISAGSGCRPGADLLISDEQVHCVTSLNRFDIAPTNRVLVNGVGDYNSLVIKDDFGSYEEQISDAAEKRVDCEGSNSSIEVALVEICARHPRAENEDSQTVEEVALRAEDFGIVHRESFSWNWSAA